jgi:hypothetical protein
VIGTSSSLSALASLLQRIAYAEGVTHGNAGEGGIFEFVVEHHRGSALIFEGRMVHVVIT